MTQVSNALCISWTSYVQKDKSILVRLRTLLHFLIYRLQLLVTARELFRKFGCSERLYQYVLDPLLQVGLFAPAEQCSAAATLGILSYFVLSQQV